jgi:hypothetical protein
MPPAVGPLNICHIEVLGDGETGWTVFTLGKLLLSNVLVHIYVHCVPRTLIGMICPKSNLECIQEDSFVHIP